MTGNGETEKGNDMQEGATGGREPGPPAVRTIASVLRAPALPTELNDAPGTFFYFLLYSSVPFTP